MQTLTVLILTPLPLEFKAVVKHLTGERKSFIKGAAAYEQGRFVGKHHIYKVLVQETGMRNTEMALAAQKAILQFHPHIVILSGIAGAIKDLEVGDIVVANKASLTSAGKEDKDGFKARPEVYYFSEELLARAQILSRKEDWKNRTIDGAPNAKVVFGGILADDKVVASTKSPIYSRLRVHFNDSISIDMESGGLGRVLQSHRTIHSLVIRGISDQLSNKARSDAGGSQPMAADRSAAFAFELLYEMDASGFISSEAPKPASTPSQKIEATQEVPSGTYIKKIAQELFKLIFAAITQGQTTGEGAEALKKIAVPLGEGLKQLRLDIDDEDRQAAVKVQLRQILSEDEDLQQEVFEILQRAKNKNNVDATVSNSKNLVQNSHISVKGNFHQGDVTNMKHTGEGDIVTGNKVIQNVYSSDKSNISQRGLANEAVETIMPTVLRAKLQVLVEQARTEESIKQLLEFVKKINHPLKNETIQLSHNWHGVLSDEIKGIKSNDQISLEKSRISARFLILLDKIN